MEDHNVEEILSGLSFQDEHFADKNKAWDEIRLAVNKRKQQRKKRKLYTLAVSVAAVACFAVWVGLRVDIESGDENRSIFLPDGSTVELLSGSQLNYNKMTWISAREVFLHGSAMFEVTKGSTFSVITNNGTVTVLGTKFFVSQKEHTLHVLCYEGAVRVDTKSGTQVLHPNEQVDCDETGIRVSEREKPRPLYIDYSNAPLEEVARKIEEIYGLEIVNMGLCQGHLFSGLISTGDMEEAVEIAFGSCGITYSIENNRLILNR